MLYIIVSIVVIILIGILFFVKNSKSNKNKNINTFSSKNNKNYIIHGSLDLNNIKLPSKFKENMNSDELINSSEFIFSLNFEGNLILFRSKEP